MPCFNRSVNRVRQVCYYRSLPAQDEVAGSPARFGTRGRRNVGVLDLFAVFRIEHKDDALTLEELVEEYIKVRPSYLERLQR